MPGCYYFKVVSHSAYKRNMMIRFYFIRLFALLRFEKNISPTAD